MEGHFCFRVIFVLLPIFAIVDYATGTNGKFPCIFAKTRSSHCQKVMPINLVNMFNNLSQSMQDRLENGDFASLTFNQFASLPEVFFTLLPLDRLSELDIAKLIAVIKAHPEDVTLAVHMTSALKSQYQKLDFLEKIRHVNASTAVQHVLASATSDIIYTLEHNEPLLSDITQMPFLMHMPPRYVLQLNVSEACKIFLHLSNHPDVINQVMNPLEKRLWASIYFKTFSEGKKQLNWLLTGYTEEELTHTSLSPDNFKADFTIIQARAAFEKVYENTVPSIFQYFEAFELLPKLTPSMLQRVPSTIQDDFKVFPSPSSVATAQQMLEYIVANCIERKKLGPNNNKWGERIKYLKKWVYVLPLSVLKQYSEYTKLSPLILNETQSEMLTNFQAYYLTMKGSEMNLSVPNSVMMYEENLLSALPTTQLVEHAMGSFNSEVLQHILAYLPDSNIPRIVSLITKIIDAFDSDAVIYNILANKAVNSYFDLISSRSIKQIATHILARLRNLENSNLKPKVQQLPPRILSVLLREAIQKNKLTWNNFINPSQPLSILVNGLNCDHLRNMETTDFILFMSHFNQQRILLRRAFPKNLQYCCLHKLMEYLQAKMELQGVDLDEGIINVLDPIEIEAVGGFVLLSLPSEAIEESKHSKLILAAIGKLSVPELLLATDTAKLKRIALLAVKQLFNPEFADYFKLGNLVWFVNPTMLPVNTTSNLKLAIEGRMLDRRLCLNEKERNSWSSFFIQMFGAPEVWSRGKLHTLGDLLLVFPEDVFLRVPETSWVDAADTLQSSYYDSVEWSQPTPFYEVCLEALIEKGERELYLISVKRLVHWMLLAAERQLRTVKKVSSSSNKIYNNVQKTNSLLKNLSKNGDMNVKPYDPTDFGTDEPTDEYYEYSEYSTVETENSSSTETEETSSTYETTTEYSDYPENGSSTETEETASTYETTTEYSEKGLSTKTKETSEFETEKSSTSITEEISTTLTKIDKETKTDESTKIKIEGRSTTEFDETATSEEISTSKITLTTHTEKEMETEANSVTKIIENVTTEEETTKAEDVSKTKMIPTQNETEIGLNSATTTEENVTSNPEDKFTNEEISRSKITSTAITVKETKTDKNPEMKRDERPTTEFKGTTIAEDDSTNESTLTTQNEKETETEVYSVTKIKENVTREYEETTTAENVSKTTIFSTQNETEIEPNSTTKIEEKVTLNFKDKLTEEEISRTKITLTTISGIEEINVTVKTGNSLITETMIDSTPNLATTIKFTNATDNIKTTSIPDSEIFSTFYSTFINNVNNIQNVTDSTDHLIEIKTLDVNTKKKVLKNERVNNSTTSSDSSLIRSTLHADNSTERSTTTSLIRSTLQADNSTERSTTTSLIRSTLQADNSTERSTTTSLIRSSLHADNSTERSTTTSLIRSTLQADNSTERSTTTSLISFSSPVDSTITENTISTSVNFTNTFSYENNTGEKLEKEEEIFSDGEPVEETMDSVFNTNSRSRRNIFISRSNIKFSCNAIKMVGKIAALSLTDDDVDNMDISEINECREVLSQLNLPEDEQKNIWGLLDEKEPIHLMGNLLKVAEPTNIVNLKLKLREPWILETISAFSQHITDTFLIQSIIDGIKFYNDLNAVNVETLAALRGFICHLDIENITSLWHRFHHVVALLGRLPGCPVCLPKLAEITISPNGFGKIEEWQIEDMETMGNIVAGLNDTQWQDVLQSPNLLLSGLQPSAIRCLSTSKLKVIPKDSYTLIPPLTLLALSNETLSQLSAEQRTAIQDVLDLKLKINIMPKKKKDILYAGYSSSTINPVPFALLILIISVNVFSNLFLFSSDIFIRPISLR